MPTIVPTGDPPDQQYRVDLLTWSPSCGVPAPVVVFVGRLDALGHGRTPGRHPDRGPGVGVAEATALIRARLGSAVEPATLFEA